MLAERARRRNVAAQTYAVKITDPPPRTADIYLLGGGEDTAQLTAARWLVRHRMRDELAERRVVLAVCAGLQLLGTTMTDRSGHTYDGAGVLDLITAPGPRRAVGEVIATATEQAIGTLTGFENHLGQTTLGPGAGPLAVLERGVGNGVPHAGRAVDGARAGSVIGTYLHGPVLARNPALADHLLALATGLNLPHSSYLTRNRCGAATSRPAVEASPRAADLRLPAVAKPKTLGAISTKATPAPGSSIT